MGLTSGTKRVAPNKSGAFPVNLPHLMNVIEYEINLFVHCQLTFTAACGLWCYGTANAKGNAMKHFRERGIYLAPSGEKFVASRERKTTSDGRRILSQFGRRLSCFLFGRYEWAFHGNPDYEVATTGNLRALKQPSNFSPDQLIDTGATAGAH
jgi:hypothetical protein